MTDSEIDETAPSGSSTFREEAVANEDQSLINGRREPREYRIETYSKEGGPETKRLFLKSKGSSEPNTRQSSLDVDFASEKGKSDDIEDIIECVSFVSGNPYVETTTGILHLYKENKLSSLESGSERCDTICILSVPATMTCHDLLTFTAACHEDIKHLRIIKDGTPNQYMALLTFRSQQMACEFFTSFNGVPFNSLEPECVCHLVFVSGVEVEESHPQPPPGHTELPTCPVCLERMDESVDGILTILCNHTFHSNCLSKWGDTSCPVCRYVQTPELEADNRCLQCLSSENLWICLLCGHVGCGRYVEGHAYKHYLVTQHCFSMLLGTNRVWDYAGDNFVHRLMQNKGDGKLVEGEQPSKETGVDEKVDSMQLEWTYHLTSQLDKQRKYFEDKMSRLQQSLTNEATDLRQKLVKASDENKQLQAELIQCHQDKANVEKKVSALSSRLNSTLSQLQDERQISRALVKNQSEWQTKFNNLEIQFREYQDTKDKELLDVKEQLRDVMFFLEAQKQIEASAEREEIAEGKIVLGEPAQAETSKLGKQRRKKHR